MKNTGRIFKALLVIMFLLLVPFKAHAENSDDAQSDGGEAAARSLTSRSATFSPCNVAGENISLTKDQCDAVMSELSVTGGEVTQNMLERLKGNPVFKDMKAEELLKLKALLQSHQQDLKKITYNKSLEKAPAQREEPIQKIDKSAFDRYIKDGVEKASRLVPFGYDFFGGVARQPANDMPVSSDYLIGPGDEIIIMLWGRVSGTYTLTVTKDGTILFPNLGPLAVSGMSFSEMKRFMAKQSQNIAGTEINVTMGRLRSIQVFLLGEVLRPRAYEVSAMATITTALMTSGGPTSIGSLRKVELKRGSKTVAVLDLYDLLIRGDKSRDLRLQDGDVIFVNTVGALMGLSGDVKRPAVYELADGTDLAAALDLAGGVIPTAYTQQIQVERFEGNERKIVIDINAREEGALKSFKLRDGDHVKVFPIVDKYQNVVTLYGNVKRSGSFELKTGMRIKDLIKSEQDLLPETYFEYGLIKRQTPPGNELKYIPFNVGNVLLKDAIKDNILLEPRDAVYVFSRWSFMSRPYVAIEGEVRCKPEPDQRVKDDVQANTERGTPGRCTFELLDNMTVKDLVMMAGGLTDNASLGTLEVYSTDETTKEKTLRKFNLARALAGEETDNVKLRKMDQVVIHSIWESVRRQTVSIYGEINRAGDYQLAENMTVRDIIFASGWIKDSAYLDEAEIASRASEHGISFEVNYRKINLKKALEGDPANNIVLKNLDTLFIKKIPEWGVVNYIEVKGEVVFPGKYVIKKGETISEIVKRAGGFTSSAYLKGAVFMRNSVKELQQRQLDESINRLEKENLEQGSNMMATAASINPEDARQQQAFVEQRRALIARMRSAKAKGRISVVLEDPERLKNKPSDITLESGDVLLIPARSAQVQVMGDVYNQTAFVFNPDEKVSDYIRKAGGISENADEARIYVLKSDGTAISNQTAGSGIFSSGLMSSRLDPGDSIVVPQKMDKIAWLRETKDLTQILYQIAVTAGVLIRVL